MSYFTNKAKELAATAAAHKEVIDTKLTSLLPFIVSLKGTELQDGYEYAELDAKVTEIKNLMIAQNTLLTRIDDCHHYANMTGE
jgi:hypothetical protein